MRTLTGQMKTTRCAFPARSAFLCLLQCNFTVQTELSLPQRQSCHHPEDPRSLLACSGIFGRALCLSIWTREALCSLANMLASQPAWQPLLPRRFGRGPPSLMKQGRLGPRAYGSSRSQTIQTCKRLTRSFGFAFLILADLAAFRLAAWASRSA